MAFVYQTISSNVDSLNSGSFYTQPDLDNVLSGSITDKYFGASEQDFIEFSVYDIDGNIKYWNTLQTSPVYNILTSTYKDVNQKTLSYSYKQYNSGYTLSFNRNILLDPLTNLSSSNVPVGNYVLSYNFIRNIGGTQDYPLIIKNISVSRKEIQLVPSFKLDPNDETGKLINLELIAFCQKKILLRDIIGILTSQLEKYQIYSNANELIANNKNIFTLMRTTFGFATDLDVIKFLNDIYVGFKNPVYGNDNQVIYDVFDGILNYLKNWLYTYYQNIVSVDELLANMQYIVNKATEIRLNKNNIFFGTNIANKKIITDFITSIFYDQFIKVVVNNIYIDYTNKFIGYLQNSLNFGNNQYYPILNYTGYIENNSPVIIVKLLDYLPQQVGLRDRCWISNISIVPLIQKFVVNAPVVRKSFKISGPNFKVKINDYKTKPVNYQSSTDLTLSSTDTNNINFYKTLTELNVNYSDFSNFIVFSSAEIRTKLLLNKVSKINQLNYKIDQYTSSSISASGALSMSYAVDVLAAQKQIDSIYNTFDGFDVYLNNQSFIQSGSNNSDLTSYIDSAIEYDKTNQDSLTNNTPQHILVDDDNADYLIFLSMIGHHFDNLYLYTNKFPTLQYSDTNLSGSTANSNNSYIASFANVLLEQFGWNPISSFDGSTISATYLSGSNSISDDQKLKTIWNRILQNLPIIYKTKGTEECVRLISNIYGIPHNLLNVKEFGGNNISNEDKSSYTFDAKYYFTKFQGNHEVILFPSPSPFTTFEFKFKVDATHPYQQNVPIQFVYASGWTLTIVKTVETGAGKLIWDSGLASMTIDDVPIFNGKIYNILFNVLTTTSEFDDPLNTENPPILVELRITSTEDDRIVFDSKRTLLLTYDYYSVITSPGTIYLGNYASPYNLFYGNIDKINIWKTQLSDDAFLDHCKNFDAYNNYSSSTNYADLYYRYSFDYPINLYTGSGYVSVPNTNKYYSTVTASAYNFSPNTVELINCIPTSASIFPYQFDEINVRQNIQLDNAGPNKYKNSKINRATETAVARLMPNERSVVSNNITQDSNLIGVYISPFKIRDDDMTNFLGNYNLMNEIGDPNNLYKNQYEKLRQLRNDYNTNNLAEVVLYQEFLTLYKHYFDGSFFDTVRQLFPIRSRIIDGIIIEPSILERNKYQNKPVDSGLSMDLSDSAYDQAYSVLGLNIAMQTASLISYVAKNGNPTIGQNNNFKQNYISDESSLRRNSILSIGGNYLTYDKTNALTSYVAYKTDVTYNIINVSSSYSHSFSEYNFAPSGSSLPVNYTVSAESYPNGHLSLKTRPLRGLNIINFEDKSISSSVFIKSNQTIYTTVNDQGIPDGSSPVEITSVNKNTNQISLTTE
jgi:hypothetical protein